MSDLLSPLWRFLMRRRWAYRAVFSGVHGDLVLRDLAKFCRVHETAFNADPRLHAMLEGRREVALRIFKHLKLTEDELWRLHSGEDK
jgi:hypothetical protein